MEPAMVLYSCATSPSSASSASSPSSPSSPSSWRELYALYLRCPNTPQSSDFHCCRCVALRARHQLPALQAMHDKVAQPGRRGEPNSERPNWEDECRSLGLTPEIVRQWKRRTQADTDIRHLLGGRAEEARQSATEDRNALAAKHLEQICRA